jgi:hypothetical protein
MYDWSCNIIGWPFAGFECFFAITCSSLWLNVLVSYCHYFASIYSSPSNFSFQSSPKALCQLKPNLKGMFTGFYWPLNCSNSVVLCVFHFITIYRLFSCLLLNHGSIVIMCFLFWVIVYWIKFITFLVVCVILLYFRIFKWYSNLYPSILSISIPIKLTTY